MNKQRRETLSKLQWQLAQIRDDIDSINEEERESFDNTPESLQQSERGEASYNAANALENAVSSLDDALNSIEEAQQ